MSWDLSGSSQTVLEQKAHDVSKSLFHRSKVDVRVVDIDFNPNGTSRCSSQRYTNPQDLQHVLDTSSDPRIRIISLHAAGGPLPLRINKDLMFQLLQRYNINPDFWHVLLSFGDPPLPSECGSTSFFHQITAQNQEILGYKLQHVEENGRQAPAMPWSARQTGVCHYRTQSLDLWIVLNQEGGSSFEKELLKLAEQGAEAQARRTWLLEDPLWLHHTLLSLHVDTWRWHLRYLSTELENRSNRVFTQTHMSDSVLGFDEVRELRRVYDQCIESHALCEGNNALIRRMQQASSIYSTPSSKKALYDTWFTSALERQRGYLQGFNTLSKKLTNTIELSSYAIDCEYQRTSASVNWNVLRLTIVSLVYLPASFVATLFGANFFDFNDGSNSLIMGSNVWILAVSWLLLTSFTFLLYALMLWWRNRRTKKSEEALRADTERQGIFRRLTREKSGLGRIDTAHSTISTIVKRVSRISGRA